MMVAVFLVGFILGGMVGIVLTAVLIIGEQNEHDNKEG